MNEFVATVALVGMVIVVASLLSGVIERVGVPLVAAFLLLGAAIGPFGLGVIDVTLQSPSLRVLATLGLALVLFTDAVTVNIREIRERWRLAWIVLIPGTLLPALLVAVSAWWLLGVPAPAAAIIGAALASTDPVVLRSVLRAPTLPASARLALRLESGMNDVVLVPIIVVAMALLVTPGDLPAAEWGPHLFGLFVLGPLLGALVGFTGIKLLATVRDRVGVRRDYESLYALGLGFAAYAAAESVGGSGFLAAFAAGLAIASLDVELCDCFLEYGEATAEMLLLLTFVALGTSLVWQGLRVVDARTAAFTVVALLARTVVLFPALTYAGLRGRDRQIVATFGPRGLSSLLLVLLPVFAGIAGAERLFTITAFVALVSLVAHGAVIGLFLRRNAPRRNAVEPLVPPPTPAGQSVLPERITLEEMRLLRERGETVVIVDARAQRAWEADDREAQGAVRIPPDDPVRSASEQRLSRHANLVIYCA